MLNFMNETSVALAVDNPSNVDISLSPHSETFQGKSVMVWASG